MDSNEKFWIWFWMVLFSGVALIILAIGISVEHNNAIEAQEYKMFLEKGYSPVEASCAISLDSRACSIVKEQNNIKVGK